MIEKFLIVPMAFAALIAAGCQSTPNAATEEAQVAPPTVEATVASEPSAEAVAFPADRTATAWVKGLACPYCVQNVDKQIEAIAGVERVHVNLPTGEVSIALSALNPATRAQLVEAIDNSGFTLDRIEMPR
jgi:copper chaperone CopZ